MTDYTDPSTHRDNLVDRRRHDYVLALVIYIGSIAIAAATAIGITNGVFYVSPGDWDAGLVAAVILGGVSLLVGTVAGVYFWNSAEIAEQELYSLDKSGQRVLFVEV